MKHAATAQAIIGLIWGFSTVPLISKDQPDVIVEFEIQLPEIRKMVTGEITMNHLKATPNWDGANFKELPISMEKAVDIARKFLSGNGCSSKNYFLKQCSLIRAHRIEESNEWYWEVTFVDRWLRPSSVYPIIAIPVLFSGKVPEALFSPLAPHVLEENEAIKKK